MILLVHGFNERRGGVDTFAHLSALMSEHGIDHQIVSYPWNFSLTTDAAVSAIMAVAKPGCRILAHSNGCTAAYECASLHNLWIKHLIMVAPPLHPDLIFPPLIERADICWNRGDRIVIPANFWRTINDVIFSRKRTVATFGPMGNRGPSGTDKRIRAHEFHKSANHSGYLRGAHARKLLGIIEPGIGAVLG